MRIIELDAGNWRSALDFYNDLLAALGAPTGHGRNINALVDSMIWGGMNAVEAPYTIRILHTTKLSQQIRDELELVNEFSRKLAQNSTSDAATTYASSGKSRLGSYVAPRKRLAVLPRTLI